MIDEIRKKWSKLTTYLKEDLWLLDTRPLPKARKFLVNLIKIFYIVLKGFVHDRCSLHASALTFITLLSVIPIIALSMAVANLLGFGNDLICRIIYKFSENVPAQIQDYLERLTHLVLHTDFLALGIIGVFFLLWIYFRAMGKLESVLNHIWGITDKRSIVRKIPLYVGLMFLVTIVFVLATSINSAAKSSDLLNYLGSGLNVKMYGMIMQNVSIFGIMAALSCFYTFMPNTKVNGWAALGGSIVAGVTWLAWQRICINFQIGISNTNAIYGAFASIPITLYWIYVNWLIVLFGAELTFAWQNYRTFSMEMDADDVSQALRRRLCFRIVYDICRTYRQGTYWSERTFYEDSHVPIRLLNSVLATLESDKIIVRLDDDHWVPARETKRITMKDVECAARGVIIGRFEHVGKMPIELAEILKAHEINYFSDLKKRNFAELLDNDENLDDTELKTI